MYIADCTGYYGKLNQLSCCLPLLSLTLLTPYKEKKKKKFFKYNLHQRNK